MDVLNNKNVLAYFVVHLVAKSLLESIVMCLFLSKITMNSTACSQSIGILIYNRMTI